LPAQCWLGSQDVEGRDASPRCCWLAIACEFGSRFIGKSEFGGFEPSPSVHHLTITSPISGVPRTVWLISSVRPAAHEIAITVGRLYLARLLQRTFPATFIPPIAAIRGACLLVRFRPFLMTTAAALLAGRRIDCPMRSASLISCLFDPRKIRRTSD
jgi:hypothetical protein